MKNIRMIYMGKYLMSIILFNICCYNVFSQYNFNNYTPITSSGEIPQEFLMQYEEKFEEDKNELSLKDKKSIRKTKEKYLLKSNYFIEQLILSGKVLFNDPIGDYVNKVADKLLESNPELRNDLQFYVVKSTIVNAYTTNRGMVFVSMGLIAQLENEAQLAYILAHEIIHHQKKHGMEAYIENENIEKGKGQYRWHSGEDKILRYSSYSKELELEADEKGLELYLKTNYDLASLNGVWDVLQYSYLPFDDETFDRSFFETPYMKFPDSYFLNGEDENEIAGKDDEDDSKATHPNIKRRRSNIEDKISNRSNEGKMKFLVSESEFDNAREIARFELSRMYSMDQEYAKSIYNSFLLLRKYPDNLYLEKCVAKALYILSKYKNEGLFSDVHEGYKKIEGSSQQLYHLLSKMSSKELNSIALHYAWKLKQKYPADTYINAIATDLFKEIISNHNAGPDDYNKKPKDELKQEMASKEDSSSIQEESKYDKIKKKKLIDKVEKEDKFIAYAFVDLFAEPSFEIAFDDMVDKCDKEKREKERELSSKEEASKRKAERQEKRKGKALGIDKIVVVDPYYVKIDERKEDQIQYLSTANSQMNFTERLEENAKLAKLDIEVLNPKTFSVNDEEKFNDFSQLNDWISEQSKIDEDLESHVILSDSVNLTPIMDHYNTSHFMWTGVLTARMSNRFTYNDFVMLCYSAIIYPLLPFVIYKMVKPQYETAYYTYLVDISKSEVRLSTSNYFSAKDRMDLMNAFIYDNMSQIKNKKRKK